MKKTIFLLMILIVFVGTSCNGKDKEKHANFIEGSDGAIGTFSYNGYVNSLGTYIETVFVPNRFKNTTEIEVKTKEKAIELAKNEIIEEYRQIDVYYDKKTRMWAILFSMSDDYHYAPGSGQLIFIDNNGMTKLAIYGGEGPPWIGDSDIVNFIYVDVYIEVREEAGCKSIDPNKFKNTTETNITTREEAIELAKNEIDQIKEYDKITVHYDEKNSIWFISFWLYGKLYKGQYVFINGQGITELVLYGE